MPCHSRRGAPSRRPPASQTRRRAPEDKGPEDLTAVLEPVLTYQYGPAQKAVATKIKTGKLQPKNAKKKPQ